MARTHVYIIDGTFSSLKNGHETNAGLIYKLLTDCGPRSDLTVGYHPGIQKAGVKGWWRAATGAGINDAIIAGYAFLASRWHPGDRIILLGFSRGAYAVRSLAGMIDRIGLIRSRHAIERRIRVAFRHYEAENATPALRTFSQRFCHRDIEVTMVGAFDTVKALGLPYPLLQRFHPAATEFHDDGLGDHIRNGFHALAIDENRPAYEALLWKRAKGWTGRLEQVWFAGDHGDVGGHTAGRQDIRTLSNIPLVWMLERAEECGLSLPPAWRARFPVDAGAPSGNNTKRGFISWLPFRELREIPPHDGNRIHETVKLRKKLVPAYAPKAIVTNATKQDGQASKTLTV